MSRVLFSLGVRGQIVRSMQEQLNFAASQIDGQFGRMTAQAVTAFQTAQSLRVTGEVDTDTWTALMDEPVPELQERALQVTAAFEGNGFSLAEGNFDGQGITWGIIGFTLVNGSLGAAIKQIQTESPGLVEQVFGDSAGQFLDIIDASAAEKTEFADSISLGAQKAVLAEPWLSAFRQLGQEPAAQAVQLAIADRDYFQPAVRTAAKFNLKTELGMALAFDIHVQNGGVASAAQAIFQQRMASHPSDIEQDVRVALANAVADNARPAYQADVRSRKLALATGSGTVHGGTFVMRNWGLADLPFSAG